jgi:hypothetical protein
MTLPRFHTEDSSVSSDTAEETRFYYADAAAVARLKFVTGLESEVLTHRGSDLGNRVNRVLYALVVQFLDARSPKRTAYKQLTHAASSHAPSVPGAAQRRKSNKPQGRLRAFRTTALVLDAA